MDELKALVPEVRFRERRLGGYDYDEVDAYVSRVSLVASNALARLAELQKLERNPVQEQGAAAQPDKSKEVEETLVRTLVRAQQTADAMISEAKSEASAVKDRARQQADKTTSDAVQAARSRLESAEKQATQKLAEAGSEAQRILSKAKQSADSEFETARAKQIAELNSLSSQKDNLSREIATLQSQQQGHLQELDRIWRALRSLANDVGAESDSEKTQSLSLLATSVTDTKPADKPAASPTNLSALPSTTIKPGDTPAAPKTLGSPPTHRDANQPISKSKPATSKPDGYKPESAKSQRAPIRDTLPADAAPESQTTPSGRRSKAKRLRSARRSRSGVPQTQPWPVLTTDSPAVFASDDGDKDQFVEQLREVVKNDLPLPSSNDAMAAFFKKPERTEKTFWKR